MIEPLHYKRQSRVVKKINEIITELNRLEKSVAKYWVKDCQDTINIGLRVPDVTPDFSTHGTAGVSVCKKCGQEMDKHDKCEPKPSGDGLRIPHCIWDEQEDQDGVWGTNCGELFTLTDGSPKSNGMKYCPFCGKPISESRL